MAEAFYFEDFFVGQLFYSAGSAKVSAEEIKEFGQKYDPQPFHLDEAAGEGSFFKGLAASGWLTAAIVMRLRVQSVQVFGRSRRDAVDPAGETGRFDPYRDRGCGRAALKFA